MDAELERLDGGARRQQQQRRPGQRFEPRDKSKKRAQRDAKYGFGGPKRLRKQNDAASAAAVDGYRPARFDDGVARKVARNVGGAGGEPWSAGQGERKGTAGCEWTPVHATTA
jgi:rRNA-processing protein EBP2